MDYSGAKVAEAGPGSLSAAHPGFSIWRPKRGHMNAQKASNYPEKAPIQNNKNKY
jgi:hypothetical protein